ncbi:MAG: hypothetical protein IPJ77_18545 [Planctomycetes bacterium]|nr:hypothetical protein [Planctomycetota bacterium]
MPARSGSLGPQTAFALGLATLCVLSWSAGCDRAPTPAPAPEHPPGTVLLLNDVPIRADEVDEYAEAYARLEPGFVETHCRRLALTNVVLPLVAARGIDPAARDAARTQAEAYKAALDSGASPNAPLAGPIAEPREGTWKRVGLEAWNATIDRQDGAWSDVIETPGAFQLVRLLKRGPQTVAQEVYLELSVVEFPYLQGETRAAIDAALDASHLVFVDPAWRDCIPTLWQHRLHAETP